MKIGPMIIMTPLIRFCFQDASNGGAATCLAHGLDAAVKALEGWGLLCGAMR